MKLKSSVSFLCTIAIFAAALFFGKSLWNRYMNSPWTRDGKIRADVVNVAPDVSGLVVRVAVKDNQLVHKGALLFTVDRERYALALSQAKARLAASKAQMVMKQQEAKRREQLDGVVVSTENRESARSQADSAEAFYQEALVAVDTAKLNLDRALVRAPVDGYVSNLNIHVGDFAAAGTAKLALIDKNSFWVYGYFEETKIPRVHVGDRAVVRLLSGGIDIQGHVDSLSSGIADRDNPTSDNDLLADVNPIFTWVRLAQRVPVRVHLDSVPAGMHLAAGMTCTVTLLPGKRVPS